MRLALRNRTLVAISVIGVVVSVALVSLLSPAALFSPAPYDGPATSEGNLNPAVITPQSAWEGIDYNQTCAACVPADPQVAVGSGYVFEMVNSSYAIWTTGGTLLVTGSLDAFFGTGTDILADPQLHFEPSNLRWFASADDLHSQQILYGASMTSDPTATWNMQHFNVGGPNYPLRSVLGVDSIDLVISTNLFNRVTSTFAGSQVWVANLTQLVGGFGPSTWNSVPNASLEAVVPAQPVGITKTMYFVSDGLGSTQSLLLYSIKGAPPAIPTFSPLATLKTYSAAPLNAVQNGSHDLVNVGDGRILGATWRLGNLWAVATDGCSPVGDTAARSCLHVWQVDTTNSSLTDDFNWSTGPSTYDFYPALSMDSGGDLTIAFGESSALLDPSLLVTGRTVADPNATLESAVFLKVGTGPDTPASHCTGAICSYGAYFGVAFEPFSKKVFWIAGEYTGTNSTGNYWHTWIASVDSVVTYPVTFSETGLPHGTNWSVTLNGEETASNESMIGLTQPNGTYSYSVASVIPADPGTRYVANSGNGNFALDGAPWNVTISFQEQFLLSTSASPSQAGLVDPATEWVNASSSVTLGALANSDYAFNLWTGNGSGSYNGSSNPANLTLAGSVTEQADFVPTTTYTLAFTENGLPSGISWEVSVNGLEFASTVPLVTFNLTNGSYSFLVPGPISGGIGVEYVGSPTYGMETVAGANVSVTINFVTEYELTVTVFPAGTGSVSPASGWNIAGALVDLSALPAPGFDFSTWSGSGSGNYSGSDDPAAVTMEGPVAETANFEATTANNVVVSFGVRPGGSGTIYFDGEGYTNAGSSSVPIGANALSEAPSSGWIFVAWSVGGGIQIGEGTVNVSGTAWINASFVAIGHVSVVTTPATCGSVSINGNSYGNGAMVLLDEGSYSVSAASCPNYGLTSITGMNHVSVAGGEMVVGGNGSVVAEFSAIPSNGTGSNQGAGTQASSWLVYLLAALLVVAIVLLLVGRRKSPPVQTPTIPPAVALAPVVSVPAAAPEPPSDPAAPWNEDT